MRSLFLLPILSIGAAVLLSVSAQSSSSPVRTAEGVLERARAYADSLYIESLKYDHGFDSIARDSVRAAQLLRESAEAGSLKAQNLLGYNLIQEGDADGLKWIEAAAMAGDPKAQGNLGYLLLNSPLVKNEPEKAAYWLERASAGGVATATSMLGDLFRDGRGVARDSLQAEALYTAALDAGLSDAGYKLADMMERKWATLPDSVQYEKGIYLYTHRVPDAALPIFRRLSDEAEEGVIRGKSLAILGDAYTRAMGVAYNHKQSLGYYLLAAIEGDPSAAFVIGELLEIFPDGLEDLPGHRILPPEAFVADYWYDKASSGGVNSAEEATRRLFTIR